MSGYTKLKTITVDTVDTDIYVTEEGNFTAKIDGTWIKPLTTLKALTEKVKASVRKVQIRIPVTHIDDSWRSEEAIIEHVTLTGIHHGNHNILYLDEEGNQQQFRWGAHDGIYRRLTPEEVAELHALKAAIKQATTALDAWKDARKVNATKLIQDAMKNRTAVDA